MNTRNGLVVLTTLAMLFGAAACTGAGTSDKLSGAAVEAPAAPIDSPVAPEAPIDSAAAPAEPDAAGQAAGVDAAAKGTPQPEPPLPANVREGVPDAKTLSAVKSSQAFIDAVAMLAEDNLAPDMARGRILNGAGGMEVSFQVGATKAGVNVASLTLGKMVWLKSGSAAPVVFYSRPGGPYPTVAPVLPPIKPPNEADPGAPEAEGQADTGAGSIDAASNASAEITGTDMTTGTDATTADAAPGAEGGADATTGDSAANPEGLQWCGGWSSWSFVSRDCGNRFWCFAKSQKGMFTTWKRTKQCNNGVRVDYKKDFDYCGCP